VSFEPVPAITGIVTASTVARYSDSFSSSVSVDDSPVVPDTTSPSLPLSCSQRAKRATPSRSRAPLASNGVTIAVITLPNRAMTEE
jgi:hypothetical protein